LAGQIEILISNYLGVINIKKTMRFEIILKPQYCALLCCRDQRFMCTYRFKMWSMTQRMGSSGSDIPFKTLFLIVEGTEGLQSTGDGTDG